MKRLLCGFLLLFLAGCASFPTKSYGPLPKTNEIFIGEVEVFKDIKIGMAGIRDIGKPVVVDDPYYKEVVEGYITTLRDELARNGFSVVEEPTSESLVIKTKIGDNPPPLGGWLGIFAMGIVGLQVEVVYKERAVFYFEDGINTTVGYPAKKQVLRLVPRIVQKLKKEFL